MEPSAPIVRRTQKDMRAFRHLAFCYYCGRPFANRRERTDDHVPPRAVFKVEDRENAPIVLDAHSTCNGERSVDDEIAGELLKLLHGVPLGPRSHLRSTTFEHDGGATSGLHGIDLRRIIARWVRASHSALYLEFLPATVKSELWEPLPAGRPTPTGFECEPIPHRQVEHAMHLQQHIRLGRVDELYASNARYRYACTWQDADSRSICLFALTVYGFEIMGEGARPDAPSRGCCGWYEHPRPKRATLGTTLIVPSPNFRPLHPFG